MSFSVSDRVKVSNQSSQYRNHLGTVVRKDGDNHYVRIDGHESAGEVLFKAGDLKTTTLAAPVVY